MPNFLSCFPSSSRRTRPDYPDTERETRSGLLQTQIEGNPDKSIKPGCVFCDVSVERGFNIVYEDERLIAFKDRSPGASTHLLIIPRYHLVSTVKELTPKHIPLLHEMSDLGYRLTRPTKMGFHIPPFSSVHHLHLHVLVAPYNLSGRLKYPLSRTWGDGISKVKSGYVRNHDDPSEQSGSGAPVQGISKVTETQGENRGDKGKGWSWFVGIDQAIGILERGNKIGVGAC